MIREIKKVILTFFLFSVFACSLLAFVYERGNEKNKELKLKTSKVSLSFTGENYYLTPVSVDFSSVIAVNYPIAAKRPYSLVWYFKEFIKEGKKFSKMDKNWLYLSAKRISIIQSSGVKFEILNNYKDINQFETWMGENEPKYWEFWNYYKVDTWEGSLGELLSVLKKKIIDINETKIAKYQKVEQLVELTGAVNQHQKRLNWIIGDLPLVDEEKKYLRRISDDIFNKVFEEIYKVVPRYEKGVFWYSADQIIENRNFGMYNLWVDTSWLGSDEKSVFSVEINENDSNPKNLNFKAGNRYGVNVGKIKIEEGMDGLIFVLRVPELTQLAGTPPKIWLKKVAYLPGGEPKVTLEKTGRNLYKVLLKNISLEKEKMLFGSQGFGWKITQKKYLGADVYEVDFQNQTERILIRVCVFSLFLLLLVIWHNSEKKTILKKFSIKRVYGLFEKIIVRLFKAILNLNKKYSLAFLFLFIFGMFIAGKDSDLYTVLIFVFWILNSFTWNLDSRFSYFIALCLMLACPVELFLKKETVAESLAILTFFFLFSGVARQHAENTDPLFDKTSWKEFLIICLDNFLVFIIFGVARVLYRVMRSEFSLYKEHFGQNFFHEFLTSVSVKLLLIWFLCFIVLKLFFKKVDKMVGYKLKIKEKVHFEKIIFIILLLIFQVKTSVLFFQKIGKTVMKNPYILRITPDIAGKGEEVTIFGHNFVDLPTENGGWVFLDGVEQTIKEWKNEKIVFLVTDEYSNTGLLNIDNMYKGKLVKSNSVKFTYIDLIESEQN